MSRPNGTSPQDNLAPFLNEGVKGYHTFLPQQERRIGKLLPSAKFPQNASPPKLFEPLTIRGHEFVNRAWVAPMCQCTSGQWSSLIIQLMKRLQTRATMVTRRTTISFIPDPWQ